MLIIKKLLRCGFLIKLMLLGSLFSMLACTQEPADDINTPDTANLHSKGLSGAHILVFSKTSGWRHDSIPAGIAALKAMANTEGFSLLATEDAQIFTDGELRKFNAIVFLNTTLDVLDDNQQIAMERYIQAGGGFVGIHAAADTEWEGDWFWYRNLVGAVFKNHPKDPSNVQRARVNISDQPNPITKGMPASFVLEDEWYNYRDIYEFNQVVATVDESTYQGGEQGAEHPIAWYHEYDGGRAFYTGLGHSIATYSDPNFLQMLTGGLSYVVGLNLNNGQPPQLDYTKSRPENNRFVKKTLVENLDEPVKLAFFPNGDALIALRPGKLIRIDYKTGELSAAGTIPGLTFLSRIELGLVGVTLDPDFVHNHYLYTVFSVQDEQNQLRMRLSRFEWKNDQLDPTTESMLLEYPIDTNCCHTGGDLEFDASGNLFMSTGDNTNPHEQEGYGPIDFRADKKYNDALRGAGNTMDLRGKVLRIKPLAEGGYSIPAGNLFTDAKVGRPEIYVMGARNPYSITYDDLSKTLFYGDVGPDATEDSELKGSRGYDEINRVTQAGNFGWPLVIGKNHPYKNYDYVTQTSGEFFDVDHPINNSPHNTGAKQLPPAQPAFIAYPYGTSDEFPELGTGGRTALVADVFHADEFPESTHRYPAYYNNKLFILDFMRAWIKVVSFDEQGRIHKIEPFAPQINYALPIDARFAPDGTLYVLEYGMSWFTGNPDARLTRVEYVGSGNRPPIAQIKVNKAQAGVPAIIEANALASQDLDGDKISYAWTLICLEPLCPPKSLGSEPQVSLNLATSGKYQLQLTVTDDQGAANSSTQDLAIGNEPPQITFASTANKTFYWPETTKLNYTVNIEDREDGRLTAATASQNPMISFAYDAGGKAQGHQALSLVEQGKDLVAANNCLGCHKLDEKSIGPAYKDVALKYAGDTKALDYLIKKIGNGGNGVWGEMNMPGFSGLSEEARRALASYVLSLADAEPKSLPLSGDLLLNAYSLSASDLASEQPFSTQESYKLRVSYSDKGAPGFAPIHLEPEFTLLPARLPLLRLVATPEAQRSKDIVKDSRDNIDTLRFSANGDWLGLSLAPLDLSGIKTIKLGTWLVKTAGVWEIEVRADNAQGELIARVEYNGTQLKSYQRVALPLQAKHSVVPLYIQVKSQQRSAASLHLGDIGFEK